MRWLMMLALAIPAGAAQDIPENPKFGEDVLVQDTLKPGLLGKYFYFAKEIKKFPAEGLAGQMAQLTRIDLQINFDPTHGPGFGDLQWKEYFAVVWAGVLRVPKDGSYAFYLKSDDGSKLYVDGKELIDNDGRHRMDEDSKSLELTTGDHELKIEYFQNRDKAGCILSWKVPGGAKEVVPRSAFWHPHEKKVDREAK